METDLILDRTLTATTGEDDRIVVEMIPALHSRDTLSEHVDEDTASIFICPSHFPHSIRTLHVLALSTFSDIPDVSHCLSPYFVRYFVWV
jgi:hypothetical protein